MWICDLSPIRRADKVPDQCHRVDNECCNAEHHPFVHVAQVVPRCHIYTALHITLQWCIAIVVA